MVVNCLSSHNSDELNSSLYRLATDLSNLKKIKNSKFKSFFSCQHPNYRDSFSLRIVFSFYIFKDDIEIK